MVRDDNPAHSVNCGLYLAKGRDELRLESADPRAPPAWTTATSTKTGTTNAPTKPSTSACRFCTPIIEKITAPTPADLETDEALDAWLPQNISTSYHISWTCKMGPGSDPMTVINQKLRVRGVLNLRVADASIMPNVVRANTNVPTMMIAERVVDFIKSGL